MAIDTINEKLALIEWDNWHEPGLPISPGALGQDDQQQLILDYPGIIWGAPSTLDIAGVLAMTGAVNKLPGLFPQGAITPIAAYVASVQKLIAGTIALAGTVSRLPAMIYAGAITAIGTYVANVQKLVAGTMGLAGTVASIRVLIKAIAGILTPTGALNRLPALLRAGALTPVGVNTLTVYKLIAGALVPTGQMFKGLFQVLAGVIGFVGAVARSIVSLITPLKIVKLDAEMVSVIKMSIEITR